MRYETMTDLTDKQTTKEKKSILNFLLNIFYALIGIGIIAIFIIMFIRGRA